MSGRAGGGDDWPMIPLECQPMEPTLDKLGRIVVPARAPWGGEWEWKRPSRAAAVAVLAVVVALAAGCRSRLQPQPHAAVAAEITRLEGVLAASPVPGGDAAGERAGLQASRRALAAGYLYASLYDLEDPMAEIRAERHAAEKREVAKGGLPAFETIWRATGAELDRAAARGLTDARLRALPAAVRALAQAARAQSELYRESARLYGRATGAANGLYYLGLARGYLEFAVFAAGLDWPGAPPGAPPARSPEPAIANLETALATTYQSGAANRPQSSFNAANSTLNFAGELTRRGELDAGLQVFLEAALAAGRIAAPPLQASDLGRLRRQSRAFHDRLAASPADASIGRLYWELAESGLAELAKTGPAAAGARQAAVILDDVLPRYLAVLENSAPAPAAQPAKRQVTVTLVRWPFT
jgi:hypothetical protein